MIQLYGLDHSKLHGVTNYKDLKVERTLEGEEVLSFSYPQFDAKYDSVKEEVYIRTKKNEYIVKEINVGDDWTEFVAKINLEDLKGNIVSNFETVEETCTNSINLALAGTGWIIGSCDVIKKRTVRKANCSSYDILQEIRNIYRCDFKFDSINKKIYIYQSMGNDKGAYFSDELNLKKLGLQSNSYDFCTRIIPRGKDGLSIKDINGGKDYVENYQYSTKVITIYWEDNRYTNAQSLLEDAKLKLDELSKPIRAYSAEIFDLANMNEKYKNILDYDVGDTITLLSKDKKIKEKQRIVKITEYPDEPERNSCDIANKTLKFEDIQAENQSIIDSADSVLTSDGGIDGSKVDSIDAITQIRNLDSEVARITNLSVINANISNLYANKASIESLSAATARIGTLETTTATITQLNSVKATINDLTANKANITDLSASNGRISNLESSTANINTLLAGNLTAANMQTNFITANSGLIANGAIKDAMIDTLSVSKILAGDISTTKFRIVSTSGNMLISDNTIQIKDSSRVRVQIGKDSSNDYNMYVWDSSGNLMFDATGLKAGGIKSKIIRDDMVSDTANINGSKIEKESLVAQINGATTTLKASKVKLDTENQTLDLAFTSLKSTVTNQGTTITNQGTAISTIQGQISTKIWQQDITTAVNNVQVGGRNLLLNSSFSKDLASWTGAGSIVNNTLEITGTSNYTREQQIVKVKPATQYTFSIELLDQTDANSFTVFLWEHKSDGTTTAVYKDNSITFQQTGKVYYTITTQPDCATIYVLLQANNGKTIHVRNVKLEEGNKATSWTPAPEDIDLQITTINTNYSTLNQTVNSISVSVGSLQTTTSSLGTRVSTAESSIATLNNSIVLKVNTTDFNTYKTSNDNAVNSKASQTSLDSTNSNISTLTTRVSTAESSISLLQNQITLKVTQTDINNSINAINIGIRNYALGTGTQAVSPTFIALNNQTFNIYTVLKLVSAKKVTISFNYNISNLTLVSGQANRIYIQLIGNNGTTFWQAISPNLTLQNGSFKFVATVTLPATNIDYTVNMRADYISGGTLIITNFKVELGDKASDWCPAIEDTQGQIDSAVTRISTAESTITQLSTSISLKVDTSTYNSYKTNNDSNISNLQSRMNSAELKITDSSIISTVRSSTAYTSDLSSKANQSDLNTTNTNVTAAQNIANAKRRVFTSTPTTPYDVGDLWITSTSSGQGDLYKCTIARASGSYTASDWVRATKYTDDTTANTVQGNLNTTNSNLSALTSRVGTAETSITQLNTSITLKVNTTDFNTLTGRVSSTESSISTLQGQITSKVDVNGVKSVIQQNPSDVQIGFNGINNNIIIDATGFNVKNGAVKIKDSNSNDLFWVDSTGRLTARHLYIYGPESGGNIDIRGTGNKGIALRSLDNGQRYFDFTTLDGGTSYAQNAASNTFTRLLANGANFYIMPSQELHIYGVNPAQPTLGLVDIDTTNFNVTNNMYAAKKVSSGGNVEAAGKVIGASIETAGAIYAKSDIKSETNVRIGSTLYTRSVCHMDGTSGYTIPFHSNVDMQNLNIFNCNLAANSISCTGTKNRIVTTEHFGTRALNAVESADCYFIDIGEGQVTEGKCIIPIDQIFKETVSLYCGYQVFLTKYGKGELYVTERNSNYFVVEGDNIGFAWEIKAKQKGYENTRLELRTA